MTRTLAENPDRAKYVGRMKAAACYKVVDSDAEHKQCDSQVIRHPPMKPFPKVPYIAAPHHRMKPACNNDIVASNISRLWAVAS